ncbi:outer membrane protein transport protein [Veronia pacifica]|uniref:Long-chain fatty acid transporter n=1 Tax=Veronia pacifica TaxID=1080227 RepID=A0A1C3EJT4_9GAMM|nr:outer membrane protein transport protein [Veronia pacifica]ODA33494.1 long-chain fatty acid transporter [Veronia pacifica]
MSRIMKRSILATTIALVSTQAYSAGFQVSEHSASGLGRAFAGEAAMADNASVMARNPASMTQFDNMQASGAIQAVLTDINVTDNTLKQNANNVAPSPLVPAGYLVAPVNDKFSAGIGLYTVYGVGTDYPDNFLTGYMAGDTNLTSVNLNPAVAYKVNENLSLGAGLDLVYATAELNRHFGELNLANPSGKMITMEGSTFAAGYNIGALYEVDQDIRFGLSYRSPVQLKFKDGKFTDHAARSVTGGGTVNADLNIELPAIIEFSGFQQLNKTWALHYSVMWTDWSVFKELKATSPKCDKANGVCFQKSEKYDDAIRWSMGSTYTLNNDWTLRAGFAFDEQAGKSTLSIPDTDRYWYSAGATYQYTPKLSVDAGVSYIASKESHFKERGSEQLAERSFTASGSATVVGIQANYSF